MAILGEALRPMRPTALCLLPLLAGGASAAEHARRLLSQAAAEVQPSAGSDASIAGAVAGAVAAFLMVALVLAIFMLRRNAAQKILPARSEDGSSGKGKKSLSKKGDDSEAAPQTSLIYMTFNDVQIATEGFKPEGLLSESMYSTVHKAEGPNAERWAVKCAKEVSLQGEHLFRNEVEFLARIVHDNIVPLRAFCDEGDEQILVFDYMPNGSLASWLRPPPDDSREALSLALRHKVAIGVAQALKFLHSFSQPKIIHRDLQSDSILLDADFKVKVGGLGLLKHLPGDSLRLRMASKKGYLDPEYFQTFKVTTKCDVYSFGVVLFEMLTGCAPMVQISRSETQRTFTLAQWAKQAVEDGKVYDILDPRMPVEDNQRWRDTVEGLTRVACACVSPLRRHRPDMAKVLEQLQKLESSPSSATLRSPRLLRCLKNEDDASSSSSTSEESQGASAVEAQLHL